jgi:hypothetical protein
MAALVVGPSRRRIVGSALAIGAVLVMAATVQLSRTPVGVIAAESAASLALTAAKVPFPAASFFCHVLHVCSDLLNMFATLPRRHANSSIGSPSPFLK